MNTKEFDALDTGTKVLIKAWDHENNVAVETVATFNGCTCYSLCLLFLFSFAAFFRF